MPIKGLTDRGLAFPEIGQIRKGAKKGANRPGMELKYWRVEFSDGDPRAKEFEKLFGKEPASIRIMLPFNEVERNWEAWLEAYTAGRLVARSDGEFIQYMVDVKTGEVKVLHGADVVNGNPVPHTDNIGTYQTGAGKSMKIKWGNVGRLKVVIPELHSLAYLTVHTTSAYDILHISQVLEALYAINRGRLAGIPLLLKRVPRYISVPAENGQRARRLKYLIDIEANPEWVKRMLTVMQAGALPAGVDKAMLLPPTIGEIPTNANLPDIEDDDPDEDDGTIPVKEAAPEPEPEQEQEQEQEQEPPARPYKPNTLLKVLNQTILDLKDAKVDGPMRARVWIVIQAACLGNELKAAEVLTRLIGRANIKDATEPEVAALAKWLAIKQDSGGEYHISGPAVQEMKWMVE